MIDIDETRPPKKPKPNKPKTDDSKVDDEEKGTSETDKGTTKLDPDQKPEKEPDQKQKPGNKK